MIMDSSSGDYDYNYFSFDFTSPDLSGEGNWSTTGDGGGGAQEFRLHPEGVPGQMESEMRRLMGDKEYEKMKSNSERHTDAIVGLLEAQGRFWNNMANLAKACAFVAVAATVSDFLRDHIKE